MTRSELGTYLILAYLVHSEGRSVFKPALSPQRTDLPYDTSPFLIQEMQNHLYDEVIYEN